jgi:serine/threonine protein kinase
MDDDHELELRNLNLLNELKHPNIVELLSSYTYRGKHNFIFPFATGGNLAMLFKEKDRPSQFTSDEAFNLAMSKLSSAIEKVHDYASDHLNLKLIGCHHDLKPKNILVHGDTFLLADFGLTNFKQATESSKTQFKIGSGHYLAPECEDYENFEKGVIGRSSDIWSLGCIISEVLTYMKKGAEGVEEFRRKREVKFRNFTTYAFHAGTSTPHEGVHTWLSELESQATRSERTLIRLIRDMLAIEPKDRPIASEVTSRLYLTTVDAYSHRVDEHYQKLHQKIESLELDIEWERFKSWKWAFGLDENGNNPLTSMIDSEVDFELTLKYLLGIRDELESIWSRYHDALAPLFLELRLLNDQLISLLPREFQERARTRLELLLIRTEDSSFLEKTQRIFENTPTHRRIGMLATIKRMSILASERSRERRPSLRSDPKVVQYTEAFEDHSLAIIEGRRVLVEWIRYDTYWEGPVSKEMIGRVEAIAELFNSVTKSARFRDELRLLQCSTFFHDPSRFAFGLVYEFPCSPLSRDVPLKPHSLADVLVASKNSRERPSLGDRFKLAYDLAVSVLDFHKVGWIHKSISAYNVAFFMAEGPKAVESVRTPYVIGFNHSRPDEPNAFSAGPDESFRHQKYRHPWYGKEAVRFRPDFDYYSLGIVLLEIGLWKTLDDMTKGFDTSSLDNLQERLLKQRVPLLGHSMGDGYCKAVKTCLKGGDFGLPMGAECTAEATISLHLSFEENVVEPLSKCSV